MKALEIIAKRLAFGAVAAWAVLTTMFLIFTLSTDWIAQRIEGEIRWAMGGSDPEDQDVVEEAIEEAIAEYAASRGLDRPLYEQYVDWMGNMVTFQWGYSLETGEPVFALVTGATVTTATYVVPAVVLAVCIGMLTGLYAALNPTSRLANGSRIGSYVLFAVPSFWLGGLYLGAAYAGMVGRSELLIEHVLPIALVTMTLLGGYVSYSRAHAMEHVSADFVALVKAKGAGPTLVARHVVRNAAIPLFAMLFTEVLGLLVLAIFVIEMLFGIDGFGLVFFFAIDARDIPVLLGCTMVIIAVGILGNIIQDVSYQYLDPRVGDS